MCALHSEEWGRTWKVPIARDYSLVNTGCVSTIVMSDGPFHAWQLPGPSQARDTLGPICCKSTS